MIPAPIQPQSEAVVAELQRLLGTDLAGVYLHGSAVLGCLGQHSDIDLVAVSRRPLGEDERRRLVTSLLELSAPYEPAGPPRPIELDLVTEDGLRPWRYPTPFDFHYGESHRARFEAGELELWETKESRDLAAHVTVLHHAGLALSGRLVAEVFPQVPWDDYADALTHDLDWCRTRFAELPRYGVLSISRIWATLATREPKSKASGAEWALLRLPTRLRPVLEHGLAGYRGETAEHWDGLPLAEYIAFVADEIDVLG